MRTWRLVRSYPLAVQVLLVNQFGVNTGFYLLIPYLAGYLGNDLGMSAAVVGIVLGVRTLSQQGLFLIGGTASDRLGARQVIIAGCALRAVGFGLFAFGTSLPMLVLASILSGLAGALFNPAVRGYISVSAGERKAEAFSLFNLFANAGALAGPLLGSALILVGFQASAICAAAIFALLTIAQIAVLPPRKVETPSTSILTDWRTVIADRRFLMFTVALTGMFALEVQLYLVLPMVATRLTGSTASVAAIFLASTIATLAFQVRVTTWAKRRWSRGRAIATGLAVMGIGFVPTGLATALTTPAEPSLGQTALRLAPILLTAICLAFGLMLAQPFAYELVGHFGGERLSGTYFGVFYLASGLTAAVANTAIGAATDLGSTSAPWLPAAICVTIGLTAAIAVRTLVRRTLFGPKEAQPAT